MQDLKDINLGLLSTNVYDYKSLIGITNKENLIAGLSLEETKDIYYIYLKKIFKEKFNYRGPIKLNREFILNIINSNIDIKDSTGIEENDLSNYEEKENNIVRRVLKHIVK